MLHEPPRIAMNSAAVAYFDASPWGGGAVLYEDRHTTAWFEVYWADYDLTP